MRADNPLISLCFQTAETQVSDYNKYPPEREKIMRQTGPQNRDFRPFFRG